MEKRYNVPAELFHQIKDVICILRLPHIMEHINKVDKLTARELNDISMKLDQIETRRILNHVLRTAYQNNDIKALEMIRAAKLELDNTPEGVDAVG